ncbi:MAG: C10 family peptidase [Candidatus Marinimicrobia bacterium]|nr:C10 family peptidase [Candidatus Neomarinimicrobiota bacterium]
MKTKRRIMICLTVFGILFSRPVGVSEALGVVSALFPCKTVDGTQSLTDEVYLVSFERGGFVLLSRDDAFPPVLAYSEEAPATGTNPAFTEQYEMYSRQIRRYAPDLREAHPGWSTLTPASFHKPDVSAEVLPLIGTTWNQSPYYNDQFPYFVVPGYTDKKAYAGCVAVVMGQLMRYYEHPARGVGRRSYYSIDTDSTLSAWYDTTLYDWFNMPDSLCSRYGVLTASPDQVRDVSLILYQSAVSVDMELKPDGSSSSYEDMMFALTSYFDYAPGMVMHEASAFTAETWTAMLKAELDEGRPIPYRGQGDGGGHAFLFDGYRVSGSSYFHVNWGWGGAYNGWFLLSALDPATGYDYTQQQGAVLGIRPNTDDIVRFAYSGFEGYQSGWIYAGAGFYGENGVNDMVYTGTYAYGFNASNQWLITPRIRIPDDDNVELSVWAKMLNSGKQCRVALSLSDTVRSSFTVELGSIAPHSSAWAEYTFNLRNYKGQDVFVGFNYLSSAGYITLDDLTMSMPRALISVEPSVPGTHELLKAYPNPFNPSTTIEFIVSSDSRVRVSVQDITGRLVSVLADRFCPAGAYRTKWDAGALPSGIYVCKFEMKDSERNPITRKLLLVK